ncbi:MAG: beta-phosphoglucomutase family hydrolase [Propionicimonas sp.]|uniref:HAD family hydrolase n=1 Tax=Propionicimonas sp. TaxID=1955623 RepID=UPI003D126EF7
MSANSTLMSVCDAALFDLDGVLTPTAEVHMRAWSRMFNAFLPTHGDQRPYTDADYFAHVDGKPRYDGVRDLLASRGIELPLGDPSDPPEAETVCGLGNRKNAEFAAVLATEGVRPYPGSVRLLDYLTGVGVQVAVVSSSANAQDVLVAAGLRDRFEVVVDGLLARRESIAGKPAPDTYLRAAEALGVPRERAVVFEDAISGVQAGRAGRFGLVVGVERGVGHDALLAEGADLVVTDLAELLP